MARIPDINPKDMSEHQRRLFDKTVARTGTLKGPARGFIYSPVLWETNNAVTDHFEDCALSRQQFRIVTLLTARYWGAEYPFAVQSGYSLKADEGRAIIEAIRNQQRPRFKDPKDEVVYDLISEQLEERKVSSETFNEAVQLLSYEAIVDALGLIGHFSRTCILTSALEIESPDDAEITLTD